jgi:hypothetical protein
MATTSLLRRPSPLTDDDVTAGAGVPSTPVTPTLTRTPLAFGGAQAADARSIAALASKPDPSLSPDAAIGTRIGRAIGGEGRDVINGGVDLVNTGRNIGAGVVNTITAPVRYAAPVARDVYNGIAGNPESPDAGNPLPGASPTPLSRPFPAGGTSAAGSGGAVASLAGVTGGVDTSGPARGPIDPAAPAAAMPALQRPSLAGVQGSGLGTVKGDLPSDVYGGVTTTDGRHLPYGAMVNGVPTFSDGSSGIPGVAGSIPRTMTDETIRNLGANLQTAPAPKAPLASDVLGYTPTSEQAAALRQPAAQPITGSRPTAAQFAASDRDAIASGDWRSSAGTVANNLTMDAQYAGTPRLRRAAATAAGAQLAGGLRAGEQAATADAEAANGAAQRNGALAVENLRGQYGLQQSALETARAVLTRQLPQTTLQDGTIAQIGQNGVVTPTRLPDGTPARTAVTRDDSATRRENDLLDQVAKGVQTQMEEHTKAQALLPENERTQASPKQIADWRGQQARAVGLPLVTNPKTGEQQVFLNGSWRAL